MIYLGQSQWPRGLRRGSAAERLLGLRVRIPPGHGYLSLVNVVYCAVRGLCDELITRSEGYYKVYICLNVISYNSRYLHLQ